MARYSAFLFDLDGTLLNTLEDLAAATNYALTQMGWPARTVEEVRQFVGNGVKLLIDRAAPADSTPEEREACLAFFKARYAAHMDDATAPYPGIPEALASLRERGCKLAVCSNKFDAAVKGLARRYFPGLLDGAVGELESAGIPKKPHPAMVDKLMEELGVKREDCVYVGDSDVDIETAKNAGLPCLSVTWGFRDRAFLLSHGATTLVDKPEELVGFGGEKVDC